MKIVFECQDMKLFDQFRHRAVFSNARERLPFDLIDESTGKGRPHHFDSSIAIARPTF